MTVSKILIAHEKYGDRYFDASTDEKLGKVCLKLLQERNELGYYEINEPCSEVITQDDVDAITVPTLKKEAEKRLKCYKEELRRYKQGVCDQEAINRAIETQDGQTALNILIWRENYEYESIQIEMLEEV